MSLPSQFITIAGNIGAGKTTLAKLLEERLGWTAHLEPVENNPYLADFYADMKRWSFPLQIHFLNHRFRAHRHLQQQVRLPNATGATQDRSIYEDANIFARNLYETGRMDKRDYLNYLALYESMCEHLSPPDLMIYIRRDVAGLVENVRKRGRDFEAQIPRNYLESLEHYYQDWLSRYDLGPVLVLETDGLDYAEDPAGQQEVIDRVMSKVSSLCS